MSKHSERRQAQAGSLALTFVALTAIFAGLGYAADRWLGTLPWLMASGVFVGAGLGFLYMVYILFGGSGRSKRKGGARSPDRKRSK